MFIYSYSLCVWQYYAQAPIVLIRLFAVLVAPFYSFVGPRAAVAPCRPADVDSVRRAFFIQGAGEHRSSADSIAAALV